MIYLLKMDQGHLMGMLLLPPIQITADPKKGQGPTGEIY